MKISTKLDKTHSFSKSIHNIQQIDIEKLRTKTKPYYKESTGSCHIQHINSSRQNPLEFDDFCYKKHKYSQKYSRPC